MGNVYLKKKSMNLMAKILKEKCPSCGNGDIFSSSGNVFLFQIPKMYERCKICNFKFERETGFFFGAMYISYAFASAQMIVVLVLGWFFLGLTPLNVFLIIAITVTFTSTFNFRLSRIIWIYLFHRKE